MYSVPPPVDRFFGNLKAMIDFGYDVITRLYKAGYKVVDPVVIDLGASIINGIPKTKLIEDFIKHSMTKEGLKVENVIEPVQWDKLHTRDETFMTENAHVIFGALPDTYVKPFVDILQLRDTAGNLVLDQIDRETIWDFVGPFVKISICYIHEQREPYYDPVVKARRYRKPFYRGIDLEYHSKKWGVDLLFPTRGA